MVQLTKEENAELIESGMDEETVARIYYMEMRRLGLTHKESVRNWVDGVNNMKSDSFTADQLNTFKQIIGRVKGKIF